jgi:hypothetical protein
MAPLLPVGSLSTSMAEGRRRSFLLGLRTEPRSGSGGEPDAPDKARGRVCGIMSGHATEFARDCRPNAAAADAPRWWSGDCVDGWN